MSNETNSTSPAKVDTLSVYAAGEMFSQHDLTTNVYLKEAIWRLSQGKYELVLPQSKELRDLDRADLDVFIRNVDLRNVIKADLILARFDGLELDSGAVVEYLLAKFLGKPAVILRSDTRRMSSDSFDEPYNLMIKNWPRSVQVHVDAMMTYIRKFGEEMENAAAGKQYKTEFNAELQAVKAGVDSIAKNIIECLNTALSLPSPYPEEYQELVYSISRFSPGGGFDELVTKEEVLEIVQRLKVNGSL